VARSGDSPSAIHGRLGSAIPGDLQPRRHAVESALIVRNTRRTHDWSGGLSSRPFPFGEGRLTDAKAPPVHPRDPGLGQRLPRAHRPVAEQHAALQQRIQGHFNYFGVNGNLKQLERLAYHARRAWFTWLRRRGQRVRLNWGRFRDLLRAFPLPIPRVVVAIWG